MTFKKDTFPGMVKYTARIEKFAKKGEKTGWSYIGISEDLANKLKRGYRVSFRVKGLLDDYRIEKTAILPMGDGSFILPVNGQIRKALRKKAGDTVNVQLEVDNRPMTVDSTFTRCLKDDPLAYDFFKMLPKSHQNYFSKWIESAKTTETKSKRIAQAVMALGMRQGFGEMMRKNKRKQLHE